MLEKTEMDAMGEITCRPALIWMVAVIEKVVVQQRTKSSRDRYLLVDLCPYSEGPNLLTIVIDYCKQHNENMVPLTIELSGA